MKKINRVVLQPSQSKIPWVKKYGSIPIEMKEDKI